MVVTAGTDTVAGLVIAVALIAGGAGIGRDTAEVVVANNLVEVGRGNNKPLLANN